MEEAAEIATWGKKTVPGTIMGTVTHMSPEQARGGKVDHRSDIFSFGVLLYEMLTGGSPFRRDSPLETLSAILKDHPPPLPRVAGAGRVDPIVSRCLAKNPDDRYQDMREVLKAIQEAQTSRPVPKLLSLAAVVLVAAAVAFFWPRIASKPPRVSTKPSVAVLYFDNASGDPSLDWLRTASPTCW